MNMMEKHGLTGHDAAFYYRFLDRLRIDCRYDLGNGQRYARVLWAHDEAEHIQLVREVYAILPEDPEWLTAEQIEEFAREMGVKQEV